MTNIFHTKIRKALSDSNLQSALDGNAIRRIAARQKAYESLPEDLQIMRQKAYMIRKDVIENLDQYLERFINHASRNGLIIHRADNAQQAVQIVLDIAQNSGAKRIVKSKSMVSEEIALNPALETHAMQVVETDLGEYIVQLRGEPPAHIITPAVHLKRKDVGELFSEKLGIPFTDDVSTLTSVARQKLRQFFLDADIGITGVNFGVAENGALCILTNEGNGRMVTTLPDIHIALMGIERLVPNMRDLSLMIELLPRSATGQKITVYTNLIFSPRRSGEVDGSQVRHLILLDNGRNRLRTSLLSEILYCIRCGACINACPIFREIGGHAYVSKYGQHTPYPGPIGSVLSPGLFGVSDFGQLARASSLCGACKEACPVDIDIPKLLLRVRAGGLQIEEQRTPVNVPSYMALGLKFFTWVAVKSRVFNLAQQAAGTFTAFLFPRQRWLKMPAFTGWGFSKDFPRPSKSSFRQLWSSGKIGNQTPSEYLQFSDDRKPTNQPTNLKAHSHNRTDLGALFAEELEKVGGHCYPCTSEDLAIKVIEWLNDHQISTIQASQASVLPNFLLQEISQSNIQINHHPDPSVRAGITGVHAAAASNGTLLLLSSKETPMTASLLPEVHLAILNEDDILPTLEDVLCLPVLETHSSAVLITGPSRTADIEMTLTIGVHGPAEVIVFLIRQSEVKKTNQFTS